MLLANVCPCKAVSPETWNFVKGLLVPIPTLPPVSWIITLPSEWPDLTYQSFLGPYLMCELIGPPALILIPLSPELLVLDYRCKGAWGFKFPIPKYPWAL